MEVAILYFEHYEKWRQSRLLPLTRDNTPALHRHSGFISFLLFIDLFFHYDIMIKPLANHRLSASDFECIVILSLCHFYLLLLRPFLSVIDDDLYWLDQWSTSRLSYVCAAGSVAPIFDFCEKGISLMDICFQCIWPLIPLHCSYLLVLPSWQITQKEHHLQLKSVQYVSNQRYENITLIFKIICNVISDNEYWVDEFVRYWQIDRLASCLTC